MTIKNIKNKKILHIRNLELSAISRKVYEEQKTGQAWLRKLKKYVKNLKLKM